VVNFACVLRSEAMRWAGFLVFVFLCGCGLFRHKSPMEQEMELVRQRHRKKAEQAMADLRARHRNEMEAKKRRLRMEYEKRLEKHRSEINQRFDQIVEERKKTYASNPTVLKEQLKAVEEQRQMALRNRERRITEEYLRHRKSAIEALQKQHAEEEAALRRQLDLELQRKLAAVRAKYQKKQEKQAVAKGPEELREKPGGEVFLVQYGPGIVRKVRVDTRPALLARRDFQAVVTLFLVPLEQKEKGPGKVALAVYFNGKRVEGTGEDVWFNLQRKIEDFARTVYKMPGVVPPEVLVDMVGDVPFKYYDKVLSVAFKAGVKNVRRASVSSVHP